jgi:excisionase family DNA binding protein
MSVIDGPGQRPRPKGRNARPPRGPGDCFLVSEAADALGVRPADIRRDIKRGNIAAAKVFAHWLIQEAEVERLASRLHRRTEHG